MATTSKAAQRVRTRKTSATGALTRIRRSLEDGASALTKGASELTKAQWTAIAIGASVLGGAALLISKPRLARRLIGGGMFVSRLPFAPPILAAMYTRAKDRVVPLLAKASPAALIG
jgi:hypothetical protein